MEERSEESSYIYDTVLVLFLIWTGVSVKGLNVKHSSSSERQCLLLWSRCNGVNVVLGVKSTRTRPA